LAPEPLADGVQGGAGLAEPCGEVVSHWPGC
jgi:hypothetical protein